MIKISGLERSSLLDYPGKVSAVVFTHGCNLKCPYCHNPELVLGKFCKKTSIPQEELFDFLDKRKGKLDGVVITGGEPLVHDSLPNFIFKIKEMGFLVKLDTNGTLPKRLEKLAEMKVLDYIAMDIKFPKSEYIKSSSVKDYTDNIERSINIIKNSKVDYEFRTTYVKGYHTMESVKSMGKMIEGAQNYYIQNFRSGNTLNPYLSSENSFSDKELKKIRGIMKKYVKNAYIR